MDNGAFQNFINQDYKSLSAWIETLNPYEFAFIATLTGFVIAPFISTNQQNSVGNFFEQIGQTLLTIGSQAVTVQNPGNNNQTTGNNSSSADFAGNNSNAYLRNELENLKREIIRMKQEFSNK